MLLWLLRGLFIAIVIGMAVAAFSTFADFQNSVWPGIRAALLILAIAGVVLFTDLWERNKQISTLSAIYFGLILGLFLGWLFSLGLEQFLDPGSAEGGNTSRQVLLVGRFFVTVVCCYITISTL